MYEVRCKEDGCPIVEKNKLLLSFVQMPVIHDSQLTTQLFLIFIFKL